MEWNRSAANIVVNSTRKKIHWNLMKNYTWKRKRFLVPNVLKVSKQRKGLQVTQKPLMKSKNPGDIALFVNNVDKPALRLPI